MQFCQTRDLKRFISQHQTRVRVKTNTASTPMGHMFCEIYPQSAAHITKIHEYSTFFQLSIYLINYYIIKFFYRSLIPDP